MDTRCILQLCDPDGLSAGDAIRLARQVSSVEPGLAGNLGAFVGLLSRSPDLDPRAMRRALELLYVVSGPINFAKACDRMSRSEDPAVSSLFRWLTVATPRRMAKRLT
jgi:hypothetical protein